MPATFNLELLPGQHVALDTIVSSDELDMARMEDGTTVDGTFWGKLVIVHDGDNHNMEFTGTRIVGDEMTPSMLVDSRVVAKLADAAKPPVAKCRLTMLTPGTQPQYCDIFLHTSPFWTLANAWPPAERQDEEGRVKYFVRAHPGGGFEHFDSEMVSTSIYYEVMCVYTYHPFSVDCFSLDASGQTQTCSTRSSLLLLVTASPCHTTTSSPTS
jgi:hypothetical protein